MVRYLFYTIGDLTYQSPLVHTLTYCKDFAMLLDTDISTVEEKELSLGSLVSELIVIVLYTSLITFYVF